MTGQQWRSGEQPAGGRPVTEVPFFAPPRGEFSAAPLGAGSAAPGAPSARFGAPAPAPWTAAGASGGGAAAWSPAATGAPVPVTGLRPLAGLATGVVVLSCLLAAGTVLDVAGWVLAQQSLAGAVAGLVVTAGLTGVQLAALVVTAVWLVRARANAARISPAARPRRGGVWTWLGWFLPIACVFVPHQLVSDVWTASAPRARRGGAPALGTWWAAWLVAVGSATAAHRVADGSAGAVTALLVLSAVAHLVALPLWIGVVRAVTDAQRP
ncbi:DUF4328 domain-containing protein [Kineococcus sp. SYSU DK006]|uniref:DUF4328 domain-containing protein n=1 Tax=Kineococcus sp. SYSU DK006 TaxID=3383127 RepID=UPI003D7D2B20